MCDQPSSAALPPLQTNGSMTAGASVDGIIVRDLQVRSQLSSGAISWFGAPWSAPRPFSSSLISSAV